MSAFDAVVISLVSAKERRASVLSQFSKAPFPWRLFDAKTPDDEVQPPYDAAQARRFMGRELSRGEIGCFLSHYHVMKEFIERDGPDWLLVFEDDVDVDFNFKFDEAVALCERVGVKYLRLYARRQAKGVFLGNFYYYNFVRYVTTPTGTQSYLVHRDLAKQWVEKITVIRQTVDLQMESFWRYNAPIYGIHPFPVMERFTPSYISREFGAPLTPKEKLLSLFQRASEKLQKLIANRALAGVDARLRRLSDEYREI